MNFASAFRICPFEEETNRDAGDGGDEEKNLLKSPSSPQPWGSL
jgi:hypothetical protein